MKKILLTNLLGLAALIAFSSEPSKRNCGTMEVFERLKAEDPSLAARMQQIESQTATYVRTKSVQKKETVQAVITVPVVFHVVYSNASQNISEAQCIAQLEQLNLDFARLNSDSSNTPVAFRSAAANTGIQFCMATRDPSGNPTNGIERRQNSKGAFNMNDQVKYYSKGGLDAWPSSSYMNIWVCNLGQKLLGYAQFPGGPAATDGIVVHYSTVGSIKQPGPGVPYQFGRTATHEVGHWLNLRHIWGDDGGSCSGSDNVFDTPNQGAENYRCPAFPKTDACSPSSPGVMFMNYMDYTYDGCMNMFTNGQSARMNALFSGSGARSSINSSGGCSVSASIPPLVPSESESGNTAVQNSERGQIERELNEIVLYPNPSYGSLQVSFNAAEEGTATIRISDMIGRSVAVKNVSFTTGKNQYHFDLSASPKGIYFVELTDDSQRIIRRLILDK